MSASRAARGLVALGVLLALAGCGPEGPAIQEVSPGKGDTNIAGDAPIRVSFNHDMDHASVEQRFVLQPAIEGCDRVVCPITWRGRTMTLEHPRNQLATDTRYRVTLKAGYRDTAGRSEGLEHFWEFRTETAPLVTAVSPGDGATEVPVDGDITVQLSRGVLPPARPDLTVVGADDPEPISYRVGVDPGDSRRLVISPLGLLRPVTRYTIHVGAGVQDLHHNTVGLGHDFRFTTGPVNLTRSLAFLVKDQAGGTSSRIAALRPAAGVSAPAPSLRVLYVSDRPITGYDWAADGTSLYVLDTGGTIAVAPLDGTNPADSGIAATAIASNPARDELAYVTPAGSLHIWQPGAHSDHEVTQAGHVSGTPAWSGDGRRLAFRADDAPGGPALRLLDRETLSVSTVTSLGSGPPGMGGALCWSSDGSALAFSRPGVTFPEVWTYRPLAAEGTGLSRVGPLDAQALAWSSDGALVLAAGRTRAGGPALLEQALAQPIPGQASGFAPVKGSRQGDADPVAPSYDRRIAFVRAAAGAPQLWIMNNDGSGVTQLTYATYDADDRLTPAGVDQPRWAPGTPGG